MAKTFDLITVTGTGMDENSAHVNAMRLIMQKIDEIATEAGLTRVDSNGDHEKTSLLSQSYVATDTDIKYMTFQVSDAYLDIYWGMTDSIVEDSNSNHSPTVTNSCRFNRNLGSTTSICTFGVSKILNENVKLFNFSMSDCLPNFGTLKIGSKNRMAIRTDSEYSFTIYSDSDINYLRGLFLSGKTFADLENEVISAEVYCYRDENYNVLDYNKKVAGAIECSNGNLIENSKYLINDKQYIYYAKPNILIEV